MDLSKLNIFGKIYNFKDTEARSKGEENAKSVGALREKLSSLKTISVSPTTPIDDNTELWIDPDATEGFSIPEINDDVTNTSDTWSSKKINNELQSLSNENNKKLESKVSIIEGKSLSTNDYTNEEKEKLKSLRNYNDSELKAELHGKLTTPTGNVKVGQILRVQSVNDDGSVVLETVEMPTESVSDVTINDESIIKDGVAEIPIANRDNILGVIKTIPYEFWGTGVGSEASTGLLRLYPASEKNIDARQKINVSPISVNNLDYAVKAAMCDGKGAAWTAEEQAAARERMGIGEWKLIADITLEESVIETTIDMLSEYTSLIVSYLVPKNTDDSGSNFNLWLSLYKNNALIKDMNWFRPAVSSGLAKRGYVKIEKIANNLYDFENADFGNPAVTFDSYMPYNGQFTKNNVVDDIGGFDKIRVREYGKIRFPAGTRFVIYAK